MGGLLPTDFTSPFNRTSLELKLVDIGDAVDVVCPFNRTSLELKRPTRTSDTRIRYDF